MKMFKWLVMFMILLFSCGPDTPTHEPTNNTNSETTCESEPPDSYQGIPLHSCYQKDDKDCCKYKNTKCVALLCRPPESGAYLPIIDHCDNHSHHR